jgi:TM2 domain-containing membrane protein YozV
LSVKERDPFLCAAGSFFFPGLGQVYCGRIMRGIIFLVPAVILAIPQLMISLSIYWFSASVWVPWTYACTFAAQITNFIVRIIATYDAHYIAQQTKTIQPQTP